ncbi:MAG: DUF6933 domain-containing protein [Pseudonocardiaceae bacterium]
MRATQKLLHRVGPPTLQDGEQSTTLLGEWYATALFWKPQVALLVNETTLLPVLMPLAPAGTLSTRIAQQIATVLTAHGTPSAIVDDELQRMRPCRFARTANRSVVGIMIEFTHLVEVRHDSNPDPDLLELALRLATTPCSPLYGRNVSPDRELGALLRFSATRDIAAGHLDD